MEAPRACEFLNNTDKAAARTSERPKFNKEVVGDSTEFDEEEEDLNIVRRAVKRIR